MNSSGGFVLERVTQPSVEAISLASMKLHLREFSSVTDLDDEITDLIVAAREWVEDFTGRALVDQKWRLTISDHVVPYTYTDTNTVTGIVNILPDGGILLRKSPVIAITSFVSVDGAGAETTIDPATYELREADSKWPRVYPLTGAVWNTGTFRIEYRAGFAAGLGSPDPTPDVTLVPVRFVQAMKLYCSALYDADEKTMSLLLDTAERIIRPEKADLAMA